MTSLSRRKPRTTRSRNTPRTGISLAVLAGWVGLAAAQAPGLPGVAAPPPAWDRTPDRPPAAAPSGPALPRLAPADARPPAAAPGTLRGRPVTFQKADGDPPAKAGERVKPGDQKNDPPVDPRTESPSRTSFLSRDNVFRLDSQLKLIDRATNELIEEERERAKKDPPKEAVEASREYYKVPSLPVLKGENSPYTPKTTGYPPVQVAIEANYVTHRRLYFEEKNSERYGWDLGITQPVVSALWFYKDVLFWPAHLASHPHERYDTSAGKCMPGSPVPYYLYPPEIDIWGVIAEAGIVTGTAIILP